MLQDATLDREQTRNDEDIEKAAVLVHEPVLDFRSAVHQLRPTAIVGVAGVHGEFTREVIAEMAR